ncbi:HrgA protein [Helicobacter cholecystus]|uniref:HrgA protein n=1 Tax=Helicobacter cholecystus TaxID=45498 RepID=A0A3D8IX59_9HELI|nr:HTH domain-containing protein [Helicobacter cholecystus]RDU69842.1 HrgA protein [Helicobacter cholecystus]VEJ25813.1 HrgA protein [Helicobacter cholecystus]
MRKYTFFDLAKEALQRADFPMTPDELWDFAKEKGLDQKLGSEGKTPQNSLGAMLYNNIKNIDSIFYISSKKPTKFWLKSRRQELDSQEVQKNIQAQEENKERARKYEFDERDLHPLLVKFMRESEEFNLYCKTIFHESSKRAKGGKNRWIHPDIVGVHYPFGFQRETLDLLQNFSQTPYELYSFELKISLDFSNLRECYFQAVSNSSWANEGYLVVLEVNESKEFINELWRLNNAFGIGVIKLNSQDLLASEILIPAEEKEILDFKTMDLLVEENPDFKKFIESINANIKVANAEYIIQKDYDKVLDDEKMEQYLKLKKIL